MNAVKYVSLFPLWILNFMSCIDFQILENKVFLEPSSLDIYSVSQLILEYLLTVFGSY